MAGTEHHYQLFDAFIRDELSEEEKQTLKDNLKEDESYRQEFEEFMVFTSAVKLHNRKALASELEQNFEPAVRQLPVMRIAASIALLIAAGITAYMVLRSPAHERLYDKYYAEVDFTLETARGPMSVLPDAKDAYEEGRYQEAITLLDEATHLEFDVEASFIRGRSYMALDNYDYAINQFEIALETPSNLEQQTNWSMALSHLALGNLEEAENYLLEMKSTPQVAQLLADINSLK